MRKRSTGAPDVGDEAAIDDCAAAIEAEIGPVEILVNSAGIIQTPVRPIELAMALYDDVIRLDQRGAYVACGAFGRRMTGRRRGAIINIASLAGMRSMPLHAYAPAKAAVIATTQCLAAEWAPAQVRVNSVSLGYTRTPALQAAIDRGERDPSALADNSALSRSRSPWKSRASSPSWPRRSLPPSGALMWRSIAAGWLRPPGTPMAACGRQAMLEG